MMSRFILLAVALWLTLCFETAHGAHQGERGVRVGYIDNSPLVFRGRDGKPKGLSLDILEHVARKEGWRLEYRNCLWQDCLAKLEKGEVDLVSDIAFSRERAKRFHFTAETLVRSWGVVVSRTGDIGSILDLEGKTVAVMAEGIHGMSLIDQAGNFGVTCRVVQGGTYGEVLELVHEKKADAGVVPRTFVGREGTRYHVEKSSLIFNPVEVRFASPGTGDRELVTAIDRQLARLKRDRDSLYYNSLEKWIPGEEKKKIPPWVKLAGAGAFALLLVSLGINLLLRLMVKAKTSELREKNKALVEEGKVRKEVETKLRESEKTLRSLLWDSPVPTVVNSTVTKEFRYVNKAYCGMRGYDFDEVVGRSLGEVGLDFGLDLDWFRQHEQVLREKGYLDGVELVRRLPDGSEQVLLASSRLITLEGEICALTSLVDITDRKRAEEALRDSEVRYREIFESVGDALVVMGPDGIVEDVNEAACRLYGYGRSELRGLANKALAAERYHLLIENELNTPGIRRSVYNEAAGVRKNGEEVRVEVRISRFYAGGRVCFLAVVRDMTERKRAEAELRKMEARLVQAQKMEAIGTLSGGIAHDFNNILGGIIGYGELAREHLRGNGEKTTRYISGILEASERARDLVRQILAFSRRSDETFRPFAPAMVVAEALDLLRATLPGNMEIKEEIPDGLEMVMGDDSQLHQVVMNLCTNARHALGPMGGIVTVRLSSERLSAPLQAYDTTLSPGTYFRIAVSDRGQGMDSEMIRRIFEPYFTTREKGEGSGLGLSVTLGIVKNHGGGVTVESRPGKGSTFTVWLPVMEEGDEKTGESGELPAGGEERILLVEDEALFMEIAREHLEALGYRVTAEPDGLGALDRFRSSPEAFDLVITDQSMPKMTGVQLSGELGKIRPEVPVLLCTGFSELLNQKTSGELGIAGFVMKPVTRRDLGEAVRKVLDMKETAWRTS